jgi:MYXO-CTERM domain-containing protein
MTTTRTAIVTVFLYLMPSLASADLIMLIESEGHGETSTASGSFAASKIHGFTNPFASLVAIGGLPCDMNCNTVGLYTAEALGEIDSTGHTRLVARAEPTAANPAGPAATVQATLTDRLLVGSEGVTFDIEIDTSLFAQGGGFGQAEYFFTLSGGMSSFSFSADRQFDMTAGSFASWSATTVDGGNAQIGVAPFFETSVTLKPFFGESFIDIVLDVQGAANCFGLGCSSIVSSLNSSCLRATGDFVSLSGYSFDCDISPGSDPDPDPIPEPASAALVLVGLLAAARSRRARRRAGVGQP